MAGIPHRRLALFSLLILIAAFAPLAVSADTVRVAIIVGPTGYLTPMLRVQADRAATLAEQAGATVVRVYSPDATWPAVRDAVAGSSVVVYLGHGYGFPSPYRNVLTSSVHDGFGLNPQIGSGDDAHQYFGESYVERLDLAPGAVVILSHLCYAAGNSEMGDPDAAVDVAVQRADNFAAGFIRAGAVAVIADAHMGPGYYVSQLLGSNSTIRDIWLSAPDAHGNQFGQESVRSPGMTTQLDPDRPGAAFNRSLVTGGDVSADQVRAGASGVVTTPAPTEPTLTGLGITFAPTILNGAPVATSTAELSLPLAAGRGADLPDHLQIAVRWDPLLLDDPGVAATEEQANSIDAPVAVPIAAPTATSTPEASGEPLPVIPPDIEIAAPEQLGTVVEPTAAHRHDHQLTSDIVLPEQTGLYRLAPTLQTDEGVPFDAPTNAMLTSLIVRVTGPVAVGIAAPAQLTSSPGAAITLPLRIANVASESWDLETVPARPNRHAQPITVPAQLRAQWVSLEARPVPVQARLTLSDQASLPGSNQIVTLDLVAPTALGDYLLVIDVWSPRFGPLSAEPGRPTIIKVTVVGAAAEDAPRPPNVPSGRLSSEP